MEWRLSVPSGSSTDPRPADVRLRSSREDVCLRDEEAAPQSQPGNKPGRLGLNQNMLLNIPADMANIWVNVLLSVSSLDLLRHKACIRSSNHLT